MSGGWVKYRPALLDGLSAADLGLNKSETQMFDIAESNLVDEYAANSLSPEDRERFEKNYLVTEERRENVAIAKGLLRMARAARIRRWAAIAVAAVAVVIVFFFTFRHRTPEDVMVLALTAGNSLSAANLPVADLDRIGKTLVLEARIEGGAPNCIATVTRVGRAEPLLRTSAMRGETVRIPMAREALEEGEFLVTLESGNVFKKDFMFRLVASR